MRYTGFKKAENGAVEVLTESGKAHPAHIVILAIGVRPETALAKTAGLELGQRGGIRVDEQMRTSNPDIYAVGDAVEVKDFVTGRMVAYPACRTANRQGRIVADVLTGRNSRYRGTQGTSICQVFDATIAQTGASEKTLNRIGDTDYEKIYIYPNSHAGYYPGAKVLATKVMFSKSNGLLLVPRFSVRMPLPNEWIPLPWLFRWAVPFTTSKNRNLPMPRLTEVPKTL